MTTTATPDAAPTIPADLVGYRAVHRALRDAAHAMAAVGPRLCAAPGTQVRAFQRYWKGYAGEVHAHHTTEDDVVFPALVERAPEIGALLGGLDADHHHLDVLMVEIEAAIARVVDGMDSTRLGGLLRELADHMDTHLGVEDREILPLIPQHFSQEEYDALEQKALEEIGFGAQALFTLPFIEAAVTPEERAAMLGGAPLPVKVILALGRRRFRRMADRALAPIDAVPASGS
jgi:hypothetical protein